MKLPRRTLALIAMHGGAWLATTLGAGPVAAQTVPVTRAADAGEQGPGLSAADQGGWQPTRKLRSEASPYVPLTITETAPRAADKAATENTAEPQAMSLAPWSPKARVAQHAVNYGEDKPAQDHRASHAAAANELQDNRGPNTSSNVRRTSAAENDRNATPQKYSGRANRADMTYGFGSERPGAATRTSMTTNAQNGSGQYRPASRSAMDADSPYASPKGRGNYRVAGREQMPTPAKPMEEIQGGRGELHFEQAGPEIYGGDASYDYDGGCCGNGSCGSCGSGGCRGRCNNCDCERCDDCWWIPDDWSDNIAAFAGVHAFKSSVDAGLNGNFGFHEGINAGLALCRDYCIGIQGGFSFTQSDFQGNAIITDDRNQTFLTAGVFRRAPACGGFQGGTAVDWLRDEYDVFMNLTQLRSEMSYVCCNGNEVGFWGTFHMKGDRDIPVSDEDLVTWRAVDQYNLFFRHQFCHGGEGRAWVGFTSDGDGLVGADMRIPIACSFAIEPAFNYLIPKHNDDSFAREGFNVSINLVWYPHCRARAADCSPFRPLLPVADNGTFMVQSNRSTVQQ